MKRHARTALIMRTLGNRCRQYFGRRLSGVVRFEGSLEEAMNAHFSNVNHKGAKEALFYGFARDDNAVRSEGGRPLQKVLPVDFVLASHSPTRDKADAIYERLDELMDDLADVCFYDPEFTDPVVQYAGGINKIEQTSSLMLSGLGSYLGRGVRFDVTRAPYIEETDG